MLKAVIAMRSFSRDVPFEIADCALRPEFDLQSTYTRATRPRISPPFFFFNVFHPQIRRQLWPSPLYLYTYRLARDELENYARSRRILWVNLPSIDRAASKLSVTSVSIVPVIVQGLFTLRIFLTVALY